MKNSRQKRTAKRKLALSLLAHDHNPPMVSVQGHVRSVWSKAMPPRAHIPFRNSSVSAGHGSARFSGRPIAGDWGANANLTGGVSDPTAHNAPKDDAPKAAKREVNDASRSRVAELLAKLDAKG